MAEHLLAGHLWDRFYGQEPEWEFEGIHSQLKAINSSNFRKISRGDD